EVAHPVPALRQEAGCEVSALADAAAEPDLTIAGQFAVALTQLRQRQVGRIGYVAGGELVGFAHIHDPRCLVELSPLGPLDFGGEDVRGDHTGDVHRILGGAVLWSVA